MAVHPLTYEYLLGRYTPYICFPDLLPPSLVSGARPPVSARSARAAPPLTGKAIPETSQRWRSHVRSSAIRCRRRK
jgi:hypothetical protein